MRGIEATIRIGKNGINKGLIEEVKKQLKKKKTVKVKMLQSFIKERDKKEAARELETKTNARIVNMTGFTFVLNRI